MKEPEYIKATNRAKVSMALTILRDVLPGENYGISSKDLTEITKRLRKAEVDLFASFKITE